MTRQHHKTVLPDFYVPHPGVSLERRYGIMNSSLNIIQSPTSINVRSAYLAQTLNALSIVLMTRSSLRSLEGNLVTRQVRVCFSHLVARLKLSSLVSLLNSYNHRETW